MRIPRVRFTIHRLMIAVLVAGLALWGLFATWPLRPPTIAERQAEASYKQAKLVREVAEYAIREYEEGIYLKEKKTSGSIARAKTDWEREVERLNPVDRAERLAQEQAEFDREQAEAQRLVLKEYAEHQSLMKSLRSDVEKARADEQAKLATYQKERARRLRLLGF